LEENTESMPKMNMVVVPSGALTLNKGKVKEEKKQNFIEELKKLFESKPAKGKPRTRGQFLKLNHKTSHYVQASLGTKDGKSLILFTIPDISEF
jgi:hypothetical protein